MTGRHIVAALRTEDITPNTLCAAAPDILDADSIGDAPLDLLVVHTR
jgi:hypothetical protein